jgi:hypothetical protein
VTALHEVLRPVDGLVTHDLAEQCVVFVPATGDLHRLNLSATAVWHALQPGVRLSHVVQELVVATGADREKIEGDVLDLVDRLQGLGLLRVDGDAAKKEGST